MFSRRIVAAANKTSPGSGLPKLSSVVESFDIAPNTGIWSWGGGVSFAGGQMTVAGDHVAMTTDSTYDFTNDTISVELVSGVTGEFGAVGAGGAGGYLIQKTSGGTLRCEARNAGSYFDGGAVQVTYNATDHRWLFIRHTGTQVLFQAAATYNGTRTTLRTAATTTVDATALTYKIQNNDANSTVWDNVNTDGGASTTPLPKLATFIDTFVVADLSQNYYFDNTINPKSQVVAGQLSTPASQDIWRGVETKNHYDATDSSVAMQITPPGVGTCTFSLTVEIPDQTGDGVPEEGRDFRWVIDVNAGVIKAAVMGVGVPLYSEAPGTYSETYDPDAHTWFRIREGTAPAGNLATGTAGTTYWDTSADGITWVNKRSRVSEAFLSDIKLVIGAYSGSATTAMFVDNINSLPTGGGAPSTPLLTGDFSTAAVNFSAVAMATDPTWLGACSSTYGASPHNNSTQAAVEQRLDARYMRIPVRWNGSSVVSSAGGGGYNNIVGLVNLYRGWGFRCLIVIAGRTNDFDGYVAGDATQIVNTLGTNLIDYSVSNEPDNQGKNAAQILAQSIQIYNDIQAAAPGTKVWGPVLASYKRTDQQQWAQNMGINRFAGVDYHHYAMGSTYETTANALAATSSWGTEITQTKADLAALGLPQVVNCDEINFSWRYGDGTPPTGNNDRFFTAVNTVFLASALGHNLRAGGRIMPYALQNGPLGLITEPNHPVNPDNRPPSTPMPGYWGVAAWTGEQRFSHYYDAFYTVSSTNNPATTEVFAVNNEDGGYNLVLINKSETTSRPVQVNLGGVTGGTFDAYQTVPTAPYDQPAQIYASGTYTNYVSFTLPAMTVTTVVLQPS